MKRNRYIPFGYAFKQGKISINPHEANAVRLIYSLCADKAGYAAITARMNAEGCAYHEGSIWNKNMVKRILDNTRYAGTDGYPAIIDDELLVRVTAAKAANPRRKTPKRIERERFAVDELVITYIPSPAVRRMNNEINRAIEKPTGDTDVIKRLIFACAAEKYNSLIGVRQDG
jgi:hypothetical protein